MTSQTASQGAQPGRGPRRRVWGDSVFLGAVAFGLVLLGDAVALFKGGRNAAPLPAFGYLFCGPGVLSLLNLFFVARDVSRGRRTAAWIGLALSSATIGWLTAPTWLGGLAR